MTKDTAADGLNVIECPQTVDKSNWANDVSWPDTFEVAVDSDDGIVRVRRTDTPNHHGWDMNLRFTCQGCVCPSGTEIGDVTVHMGASSGRRDADGWLTEDTSADGLWCPQTVDKTNWDNDVTYPDVFQVAVDSDLGKVKVKRMDSSDEWGMKLVFKCKGCV